ncbi:MAG: GPW/gp25 family protein [Chitinophagales bacterium]|nr:GPW/gp25 family protein [Chitinophagales bacterium]
MVEYYSMPLKFADLFKKKELARCRDIGDSISQNIQLILTSRFGEYRYDPTYGCDIWEHDFENIFLQDNWNDRVSNSLKLIIEQHEPRLKDIDVSAVVSQEELSGTGNRRIKQRVTVTVRGKLVTTNERFETVQKLFISPLSF